MITKSSLLKFILVVFLLISSAFVFAQVLVVENISYLSSKDASRAEISIGNLFADAIRTQLNADIGFIAASEIKETSKPIPPGKLSINDLIALVSYPDDTLAVLELKGAMVKQALERSVSAYPQPNLGFLQVSGITFKFDPSKEPGERIISVWLGNTQISENKSYTVAILNSMANGALGYWKVWSKDNIRQRFPDITMVKAVENYLKNNTKIDYEKTNRIMAVK